MSLSSYINFKNALGLAAAFYLGTYLHIRGGIAEAPILLLGLFAFVVTGFKQRGKLLHDLSPNERWFVAALFLFGAWSAFTVWLDNGETSFYEAPARFIVGSLIAIPILTKRVDIRWVQLGAAVSTILLVYLVSTTYNGGRFAPTMNATKWGNAIAFHALLCGALAIVSLRIELRIFFILAAVFGIYATAITGTRGAMLPVLLGLAYLGVLSIKSAKAWVAIIMGVLIVALLAPQLPIVKSRLTATETEVTQILNDDFRGSVGQRLTMWAAGAQAGLRNPILGTGYDYAKTMNSFSAPTKGLAEAAARAAKAHSNHHSAYIDTLARSGFAGMMCNKGHAGLLIVAPIIGNAVAGISDSTLVTGITITYFAVASTILKSTEDPPESCTLSQTNQTAQ